MDARLYKAAIDGDVGMLHSILLHDSTTLHQVQTTSMGETVLHIASLLGHCEFIKEILHRNPALAREVNRHGYSPLHLASDNGHVEVVEELLKVGSDLCLLKDDDGRMPVHIAAMRGRIDVLDKLVQADSEALEKMTARGETVLHMCVKGNRIEALKYLFEKPNYNDLVNVKDAKGNTILHVATARKAIEIVRFVVRSTQVEVNAKNQRGETALDLLPNQSPMVDIDAGLEEIIVGAGGLSGREPLDQESHVVDVPSGLRLSESWKEKHAKHKDWLNESHSTLMVVATLIATITFQAGVNPPGGYYLHNQDDHIVKPYYDGKAVLSSSRFFALFVVCDAIGLFSSLCVILMMMTALPLKKKILTRILVRVMFVAIISTGLAFLLLVIAISTATNNPNNLVVSITVIACDILWLIIIIVSVSWQLFQIMFWCCPKFRQHIKWATIVFSTVIFLAIFILYGWIIALNKRHIHSKTACAYGAREYYPIVADG